MEASGSAKAKGLEVSACTMAARWPCGRYSASTGEHGPRRKARRSGKPPPDTERLASPPPRPPTSPPPAASKTAGENRRNNPALRGAGRFSSGEPEHLGQRRSENLPETLRGKARIGSGEEDGRTEDVRPSLGEAGAGVLYAGGTTPADMGSKRATGGKHSCVERIQRRSEDGRGNRRRIVRRGRTKDRGRRWTRGRRSPWTG